MLEVGNDVFNIPEEQTHYSLWAITKSPLIIGAALADAYASISPASLAVLLNTEVISYNQDSLGVAASFRRRWTDEYEVWASPLSGGRTVVAIINLQDFETTLTLDLPDVGLQKAGTLKDIWNGVAKTNVLTSYSASVQAHGTLLLELGTTTASGIYSVSDATVVVYVIQIHFQNQTKDHQVQRPHSPKFTAPQQATTIPRLFHSLQAAPPLRR
jgi:alpha-galactosidase